MVAKLVGDGSGSVGSGLRAGAAAGGGGGAEHARKEGGLVQAGLVGFGVAA